MNGPAGMKRHEAAKITQGVARAQLLGSRRESLSRKPNLATRGSPSAWDSHDEQLLLDLLAIDTVTPMETGRPSRLREAQECFADAAADCGFAIAQHLPAPCEALEDSQVPTAVRRSAAQMGKEFLACQPNLVMRIGHEQNPASPTLVFNGHLDTVGPLLKIGTSANAVHGRGALDAKGPMVAMLAGVRHALVTRPEIAQRMTILLHAVGGEEGGAMGIYGSRQLVKEGLTGRLNVVVEPTRMKFIDHATAAMTARITVLGTGATDDAPERGENATLILAHLACEITRALSRPARERGAKLCIAGLDTGAMHNRVYGTGQLLVNIAYGSLAGARHLETLLERTVARAQGSFMRRLGHLGPAARAAARWPDIVKLEWAKRGLPVLANRDAAIEQVLTRAGIPRSGADDCPPFTCDAIWLQVEHGYTIVFGPGDLERNGAHADTEHIDIHELERYAAQVSTLVQAFDGADIPAR